MRYLWLALVALLSSNVWAVSKDFSFHMKTTKDKICMTKRQSWHAETGVDAEGKLCSSGLGILRIRMMDPPEDESYPLGIYLERPFLIVDGIDLDPVEKRTLTDLENDVQQVGLPSILKSLGYTPILVQFNETVRRSLQENANALSALLDFLNNNTRIPFPGAKDDGFVIMGISQGGVIGRYGAYLYDTHRKPDDAPIRLFSSLDSPHQGAVMPMGLFNTIAFWSDQGGSSAAEMFKDVLLGKGAADLLLYENKCEGGTCGSEANTRGRFLFEDYRKAAEYKGFPTVLIAQGQLKGYSPEHKNEYYRLERVATKGPFTLGSAISRILYSDNGGTVSFNRKKETTDDPDRVDYRGTSSYDFIQGSTYPFATTIYNSLRQGFLDAMPDGMKKDLFVIDMNIQTKWNEDRLIQGSSTFIPTASAMDLKCNGDLAIRSDCGFSQSYSFPFENPGNRSTATATYAVDPSHPRYAEAMSGRHVEMPFDGESVNPVVLAGMQVDMWRILCEVAKQDYDVNAGQFRNPKLTGFFSPNVSCMDVSKIPDVILNAGVVQEIPFAYARYDYNEAATEKDASVSFKLPAGWKKVALWNHGGNIQANTSFEVDVKIEHPKGNWMKAELLLCRMKSCSSYLQLNEISVPVDGMSHLLRWPMPASDGALNGFRWFRLVLNSDGGDVTIENPHILLNTRGGDVVPPKIGSSKIYPNQYEYFAWNSDVLLNSYVDDMGSGLEIVYNGIRRGMHFEFGKSVSMDDYTNLVIDYWPGTCQHTVAFFDSKKLNDANLASNSLQNGFVRKILPLDEIIDLNVTPQGSKSAHRLNLQSVWPSERCVVKSIMLK